MEEATEQLARKTMNEMLAVRSDTLEAWDGQLSDS